MASGRYDPYAIPENTVVDVEAIRQSLGDKGPLPRLILNNIEPTIIHERVYRGAAVQSIGNGAYTKIIWDGQTRSATPPLWNVATPTRITIGRSGVYVIAYGAQLDVGAGGVNRLARLIVNNVDIYHNTAMPFVGVPIGGGTAIARLFPGDYVEVEVYQDSGGALNLIQGANTHLDVARIGA